MKNKKLIPLFFVLILIPIMFSMTKPVKATDYDLLGNTGFETGSLSPWVTNFPSTYVTSAYHRTGFYAAVTEGNPDYGELNQTFTPTPWINITHILLSVLAIDTEYANYKVILVDTNSIEYPSGVSTGYYYWQDFDFSGYFNVSYPELNGKTIARICVKNIHWAGFTRLVFDDISIKSTILGGIPPIPPLPTPPEGYDTWYSNMIISFMVMFTLVFVPPMILSFEFGRYKADPVIGFLGGLVLTVGIGYMSGLVPVWFVFLISLVMTLIILAKTGVLTRSQ